VTTINFPVLSVCYCAFPLSSFRRCEQLIASCSPSRITMQMRQRSMCGEVIARRCAPPGLEKLQILCSQTVVSRVETSKLVHIENLENRIIPPASVSAASQSRRERSSFASLRSQIPQQMIKLSSISANKTVGLPVKSHVVKIFLLKKQFTDPHKASSVIRLRPKTSLQNFGKREFHLHENITVHTKRMTRRSKNLRNSKYTRHKAHTKHTTTLHTNHQIAGCKNQTKRNLERKLDPPVLNPKMNEKKLDRRI